MFSKDHILSLPPHHEVLQPGAPLPNRRLYNLLQKAKAGITHPSSSPEGAAFFDEDETLLRLLWPEPILGVFPGDAQVVTCFVTFEVLRSAVGQL